MNRPDSTLEDPRIWDEPFLDERDACGRCEGRGKIDGEVCEDCGGTGVAPTPEDEDG